MNRFLKGLVVAVAALALVACHQKGPAAVDGARILAADNDPGNWMTQGRTYSEQRYSPLDKINTSNVANLGLAWNFELSTNRGVETTPIVVDGVMYVTSSWSLVYALNAKTGELIWKYDPQVPRETGFKACCDVVNRGVAVWNGRVYVATLDGRLVALDAKTGTPAWSVVTVDQSKPFVITMAPRIIKGRVLIGNSGSEYGVRGYLSAYDADTGKLAWRFFTVPGDPSKGFENKAMEMAAKTWTGEWWKFGGGGTVWDSLAYDPEANLVYFGTGNGLPWVDRVRSPGGGDNLFLASIVAVDADTGEYRWHYQTTPGDTWDFDSTQTLTVADLTIGGQPRKVVMQANKNGFFYVIDRITGKLISANAFVPMSWAKGVDMATGRPIEVGDDRYRKGLTAVFPGAFGGHNWHPASFSPKTGLVYIPAQEAAFGYGEDRRFSFAQGQENLAEDPAVFALPKDPKALAAMRNSMKGYLLAWNPVTGKEAWRAEHKGPWNGGTLATAGGLVFQGTADGHFAAYDASTGKPLWSAQTYTATLAGPVTYTVDGEQYVAVAAGDGSLFYLVGGFALDRKGTPDNGRIVVYKLGGAATLPKPTLVKLVMPKPPAASASAATVAAGQDGYNRYCAVCHGLGAIGAGVLPDLRYSPLLGDTAGFRDVVIGGARKANGMVSFSQVLKDTDADAVRAYLITEANAAYSQEHASR
ncbi:MAG: PQQ-dependent dehydrogenase, methanol/ethanol family [Caulobacterales bacterium]